MEDPPIILNSATLLAIGGLMGVLTGAITFLTRQLLRSKNSQIEDMKQDRDYWRDKMMHLVENKLAGDEPGSQDHP